MLYPGELVIDDDTSNDVPFDKNFGRGYVPPSAEEVLEAGLGQPPSELILIPRSEWSARIKEKEILKSRLSDIRGTAPSLSQGQSNYCWNHSTVQCATLDRLLKGHKHTPLSGFAGAVIIKRGANQGGWCGSSAKFAHEVGVPSQQAWPQGNFSTRLDTPELRADAAKRKVTEGWWDFGRREWEQRLTFDQLATLLLSNVPCVGDFMWWGHSVCVMDLVEVESGSFGVRIWNSWGDQWSSRGMGVLRGSQAIPDGAIAIRSSVPSP